MSLTSFVFPFNVILINVNHLMLYYIYVIPHSKNTVKHNQLKPPCILIVAYYLSTVAHSLYILVDELPLWLTIKFPDLCICMYIRTYTGGLPPARTLWVNAIWRE